MYPYISALGISIVKGFCSQYSSGILDQPYFIILPSFNRPIHVMSAILWIQDLLAFLRQWQMLNGYWSAAMLLEFSSTMHLTPAKHLWNC